MNNPDAFNMGYIKRYIRYNNDNGITNQKGGAIKWHLSPLFGYLDHKKVSVNLPIRVHLQRRKNDTEIFNGVDDANAKLVISKLELWIPNIQPSLELEKTVAKRLNTDKDIKVNILKRNTYTTTIPQMRYTWHVANVSNTPRYLLLAFKATGKNKSFNVDNSTYVSYAENEDGVGAAVKITDVQVTLNQLRYPMDPIKLDSEKSNIFDAYEYYEEMCRNFGHSPMLNTYDYANLYPIFCFDLSAQDENLTKNGVNIQIHIEKSHAESLTAYCLILEDCSYNIKLLNGQMTRVE